MERYALIEMAQNGDKEARDKLVQENVGLVWSIVKRFIGRGYDSEDLFQIGCIGLIKAVDKFDNRYEVQFSTYAVPLIMGEIKRFMRDDGPVKISRSIKENNWKVKKSVQKLEQKLGREPTIEEISKDTMISVEDIIQAMELITDVESIYKSIYQNDGSEVYLIDKISDGNVNENDDEKIINNMVLEQVINELNELEKNIIIMRYFQDKTQTEIAKRLGISQVQVSRIEKKILINLRNKING
jgi:RNA polymerase sporulation-specific sigma factor